MSSFMHAYRAEYLKLRTTASLWWSSLIFVVLGLLVPIAMGTRWATHPEDLEAYGPPTPDTILSGLFVACLPVVVVQAAMTVSTEYRFGGQTVTLLATPRRVVVAAAKLLAYVVHVVVLAAVVVLVAYLLTGVLVPGMSPASFLTDREALAYLWSVPLGMALLTAFTQGIAMLVRNTAGTAVLVLAWMWVLEEAVGVLPTIGVRVADYLPFRNLLAFVTQMPVGDGGVIGSGLYFALWAAAIWGLGVALFHRRDA
ncbi:hypothetical protein H7347_03985 [Corynebacterium sp. zg-331]|uniref:hypothetical protein n=1 Tax=unclassified Corynebacterium TaxID=2624378 RepID=UPI00128E579B|nr:MULTISPECIES: hypothetical protein [unclassified Corynebacterium]MBC3185741.1 hypothetical protein [Corynebacterium sp. zg-331]MPV52234.1 hypothetical protein [Corynebacterium sp. zg331]